MYSGKNYTLEVLAIKDEDEVIAIMRSSRDKGLTSKEASLRLQQYGRNELQRNKHRSELLQLVEHIKNPLVIILMTAALLAFFMGEMANAGIICVIIVLSIALDYWQEKGARKAAEALRKTVGSKTTVIRDGISTELAPGELCPGDIIVLNAGSLIPADARVIASRDCYVNQSSLTGESFPVTKTAGPAPATDDLTFPENIIFMGSSMVSGTAQAIVINTGSRTSFGRIAEKLQQKREVTNFGKGVQQFGQLVMKITIILVLFIFLINAVNQRDLLESFMFSLAVAVGLTPELLPLIMSITMSKGAVHMASKGVIVKNVTAIPNFGSMEILCTDKTGTITEDRIVMIKCVDIDNNENEELFLQAYLNSYLQTGVRNQLDEAIVHYKTPDISAFSKIDELPFDFYRKRMSTIVKHEGRHLLICKGAPEEVLKVCLEHDGVSAKALELYHSLSMDGFRVLAVATRYIAPKEQYTKEDEQQLELQGFTAFLDPPKPDAQRVIETLNEMGVEIKIITGDNHLVTQKICNEIGLPIKGIMQGTELVHIPDDALQRKVADITIFARFSPDEKNRVIQALKAYHRSVGYMGDGINDAPSLRSADIGITVNTATDVAREAADIILTRKELLVLKEGILEGRKTFGNTMKYILMDLSSNFGNMFSVAAATLLLPFLPMLPVQILINNLLYDTSQIAIPADHVDESYLMKPQRWDMRMVRNFMLIFGLLSSLFDLLAFYLLYRFFGVSEAQFRTGWFMESLATQILVVFIIRTNQIPFIQSRPSPKLVLSASLCLFGGWLLPYLPFSHVAGFVPIPLPIAGYLTGLVAIYLCCAELLKRLILKRSLVLNVDRARV